MMSRKVIGAKPARVKAEETTKAPRFSAKGLNAQRARLELSAADFGKLLGVSAQSIHNRETEKANPRVDRQVWYPPGAREEGSGGEVGGTGGGVDV